MAAYGIADILCHYTAADTGYGYLADNWNKLPEGRLPSY